MNRIRAWMGILGTGMVLATAPLHATEDAAPATLSLTLEQAVEMALGQNRQVLKAEQDVTQAEGAVTEYKADAFPQIAFNFEWKHNLLIEKQTVDFGGPFTPLLTSMGLPPIPPQEIKLVPPDEYTFTVGLTQNIFTFGRLENAIRLAKLYVELARQQRGVTAQNVRLEVTQAYYQVLFATELVEVARISLAQAEETRANLRAKFERGVASEYDYLRSEVEVATRRPPLIAAQTGVEIAEKNLKRLLGVDLSTPLRLTSGFREEAAIPDLPEARDEALRARDEIKLVQLQYETARRKRNLYLSDMLPSISGFSNYTYTGSEQTGFGGSGELDWLQFWDAGLRFYAPIFDGLRNIGRMRQAKADMAKAELDRLELEDGILLDVESRHTRLVTIREELVALRKAVAFAERTVALAKLRFDSGLGTQLDVIDAQTALAAARNSLADARYRYNVELAGFERALGRY